MGRVKYRNISYSFNFQVFSAHGEVLEDRSLADSVRLLSEATLSEAPLSEIDRDVWSAHESSNYLVGKSMTEPVTESESMTLKNNLNLIPTVQATDIDAFSAMFESKFENAITIENGHVL